MARLQITVKSDISLRLDGEERLLGCPPPGKHLLKTLLEHHHAVVVTFQTLEQGGRVTGQVSTALKCLLDTLWPQMDADGRRKVTNVTYILPDDAAADEALLCLKRLGKSELLLQIEKNHPDVWVDAWRDERGPILPSGTITFLFTDIVGSSELWERDAQQMSRMLSRHDALLRDAIEGHNGVIFKTGGDSFCAAFATAPDALLASVQAQRVLSAEAWPLPLRVRMALHAGIAEQRDGDYFGPALNRVAHLMNIAHGGQILLSLAAGELLHDCLPPECSLKDVGQHRLKHLQRPEQVFQLWHPELQGAFPSLRSPEGSDRPNNLPCQLTSFIGRECEMGEVRGLLARTRLLTLSGSGGCGKTRLSLQAAAEGLKDYPEGAWFVELAALSDPALVPQALAGALGIKENVGSSLTQTLVDHLKTHDALLIFDNCEHLLEACALLAVRLLQQCPKLHILATSREGLDIAGEVIYRVPSLSLPARGEPLTPANIIESEAVRLFAERAKAAVPDFEVTGENAAAIASICRQLDGIPFAIELAAAKVRALTAEQIDARLEDRFHLLRNGSRAALPRQQTLRAMLDWSYNLLTPEEQTLLARLSVFAGGCTLEAAEQVCGEEKLFPFSFLLSPDDVLELLTELVSKSLVAAETNGSATRYHLQETMRQYAGEKLQVSGQTEHVRERHLNCFLQLAEEAERQLDGVEQQAWLNLLEAEHDNMRVALAVCKSSPTRAESGLKLAGALSNFWEVRGHFGEGRAYLSQMLAQDGAQARTTIRAQALNNAGFLAGLQGDYAQARALQTEALTIHRELNDRQGIAAALANLGVAFGAQGDYAQARALHEEALAIQRELGDRQGIANSLANLGIVAFRRSDYASARALYEEALAIQRELKARQKIAALLSSLGLIVSSQGDYDRAHGLHEEALIIQRELEDKQGIAIALLSLGIVAAHRGEYLSAGELYAEALVILHTLELKQGIAYAIELMAGLALAQQETWKAAQLWGSAESLREGIGVPLPANEQVKREEKVAVARALLGEQALKEAWAKGRALSLEQAIDCALQKSLAGTFDLPPASHR